MICVSVVWDNSTAWRHLTMSHHNNARSPLVVLPVMVFGRLYHCHVCSIVIPLPAASLAESAAHSPVTQQRHMPLSSHNKLRRAGSHCAQTCIARMCAWTCVPPLAEGAIVEIHFRRHWEKVQKGSGLLVCWSICEHACAHFWQDLGEPHQSAVMCLGTHTPPCTKSDPAHRRADGR